MHRLIDAAIALLTRIPLAATSFFIYAHTLTPPALDAEIRSIVRLEDLEVFVEVMTMRLKQHLDFEAVQAMLRCFMQVHTDVLIANGVRSTADGVANVVGMEVDPEQDADAELDEGAGLREAVRKLIVEQYRESARVLDLLDYCTGVLAFVRDIPLV